MRMLRFFICILQLAICNLVWLSTAPAQVVIHVGPRGDDAADGSTAHPLKTLHGAQQLMRRRFATGAARFVRVEIAPGRYFLNEPMVFTPDDSGESPEHPVSFVAKGGRVTISGGEPIIGWRQVGDRWAATLPGKIPAPRDLWINGHRAIRARSPNKDFYRIDQAGPDNRTSFRVQPADLLHLTKPQSAEVVFLHDWSISRVRLADIDAATQTYRFSDAIGAYLPQFVISNFVPHARYFVENSPELLDAPGEWYYEPTNRTLSYIPREGETLITADVVAPRLPQLVIIRGKQGKPVTNIEFDDVTFSCSRFDIPRHGFAGIQACFHERRLSPGDTQDVAITPAIQVDNAHGCSFTNCRFECLAGSGLHIEHSRNCRVVRTTFREIGGNGVMIGSTPHADAALAQNNIVENCLVENCGTTYFGAVGVWIGIAADTIVRNNELRDLPYSGISIGWCWGDAKTDCRGNQILRNHIHDVMQILSDGGGIYTLGRQPGTVLAENVIHHVPPNAGRAQSNGIFMDEGSTDILVAHNTIYHIACSPIRFNMAGINTLVENRLAMASGVPALHYDGTSPKTKLVDNEEITNADWKPPPNDPAF
ncbi:MAG TPA: right-handed parallel beta-helix repeat-containing protein, partial [Lacipirellulaceae bacterium]|nr:right-handed parallel beta-helix repeat-containing protein [Lacipirellulaceae bacterium]